MRSSVCRTHLIVHDINVGDASTIKQGIYCANTVKSECLDGEVR